MTLSTRRVAGIALALLAVAAVAAWFLDRNLDAPVAAAVDVDPAHVDAAYEGIRVSIHGELRVIKPPRDADLGIDATDAVALLRDVEMLQWHESCEAACVHRLDWSATLVDSNAFREPQAHANATSMPFTAARFDAAELRLGAFQPDPAIAAAGVDPVPFPLRITQLPPNLAATFRECAGALCTGEEHLPAAGDVRVRYRVLPAGVRTLVGVQRGDRLEGEAR
jgi:hypothetical protein